MIFYFEMHTKKDWIRQYEYKHLHGQSDVMMHHVQPPLDRTINTAVPIPDLGAAVLEELEEFGDHDAERPVESVAVQQLRRVLADLLQCSKRALRHGHTHREAVKSKTQTHTDTKRRKTTTASEKECFLLKAEKGLIISQSGEYFLTVFWFTEKY